MGHKNCQILVRKAAVHCPFFLIVVSHPPPKLGYDVGKVLLNICRCEMFDAIDVQPQTSSLRSRECCDYGRGRAENEVANSLCHATFRAVVGREKLYCVMEEKNAIGEKRCPGMVK
jgi:hypothetical protein